MILPRINECCLCGYVQYRFIQMTRFRLSRSKACDIRRHQCMDIYSHKFLQETHRSIEHVIPVRLIHRKDAQLDIGHLYVTSTTMNRFRSDYAFGGCQERIHYEKASWVMLEGNYRSSKHRLFYPRVGHRLIAHVTWRMMEKYPWLRDVEHQCFASWEVWSTWLQTPWTPMEEYMLEKNQQLFHKIKK